MTKLKYVKLFENFDIKKFKSDKYIKAFIAVSLDIISGDYNSFKDVKDKGIRFVSPSGLAGEIYQNILRNQKEIDKDSISNDLKKLWSDKLNSDKLYKWGGWVGYMGKLSNNKVIRDFDEDEEKTYNRYLSIDTSDLHNVEIFINNLSKIHKDLRKLSNDKKRNILWKTHSSVVDFINDNDNIKFYFFDNSLKNDINKIIEDWLKKYNIKTIKRHHNVGVDIKKYDVDGNKIFDKSFGQILSHLIVIKIFNNLKRIYEKSYKGKKMTIQDFDNITNQFEKNLNREDGNSIINNIIKNKKDGKINENEMINYIKNISENPDLILNSNVFLK